jgi:hypothetical protein
MKVRKAAVVAASVVLGVAVLTGCDNKFSEPFKDAGRSGQDNNAPAGVISFPDGFSNWARKCDGPNMIYSAYHGDKAYAAGYVVANDPRCTNR